MVRFALEPVADPARRTHAPCQTGFGPPSDIARWATVLEKETSANGSAAGLWAIAGR
jgi:hypothetical protein